MRIYEVTAHRKRFNHIVTYDSPDNTVSCSCKKFEFAGILCSHALKVLSANDVKTIPSQYISKRWTKDIKDQQPKVSCPNANDDDAHAKITRRYRELARLHTELATIAAESDEAYEIVAVALHKTLADVKASLKKTHQEAPKVTSPINNSAPDANNSAPEVNSGDFDEQRVRGIKVKERIVRKEDSIRPKNALEKLLGNKRNRKEVDTSSRHQKEPELDRTIVNSTCVPATQVQLHSTQQMEMQPHPLNEQTQSTMRASMEQYMKHNHGAQYPQVIPMNNGSQKPNALPPRMQFQSPVLIPQMQFISPFPHVQNLGGSYVGINYPQGFGMNYQQPLPTNLNRVPSINFTRTGTISTEEGRDLLYRNVQTPR